MRIPLSWLNEYVSIDDIDPDALVERLTFAGLEVTAVEHVGDWWDRDLIRVGEVLSVEEHPNADRLVLATVSYSEYSADEPQTVVTGAPNVRAGMKVAFATVGATVINGYSDDREKITLKPATLRGVRSEGMVLSERELGLSDEHEGILALDPEAPVGTPLQDWLGDVVLEIDILPNIARCMSIVGVAREVAALYDRPLTYPDLSWETTQQFGGPFVELVIRDPDRCPRFVASLITDVTITPSPAWMQHRLRLVGMRPINNIVDITNYVMVELGEPLHAFDYDKLVERAEHSGRKIPQIIMRQAEEGETLVTLDDVERHLSPEDTLVTDTAGILSIAGVMGGEETEVSTQTTRVLLEAASWNFISIRRTSRRHKLHSEAAARFSRGVHPALALDGNKRAAKLMGRLAGGVIADEIADAYPAPPATVTVDLDLDFVQRLLGLPLATEEATDVLERLEFSVEARAARHLRVTAPGHRLDVEGQADLAEEIVRIIGLDRLPGTMMDDELPPLRIDRERELEERVRDLLVTAGLQETISYAMTTPEAEARLVLGVDDQNVDDAGHVRLRNPISQKRRVMRQTLLVSLVENLQHNTRHHDRVAIFELGSVYLPRDESVLPEERLKLGIAMTGPASPSSWLEPEPRSMDFFDLKGIVEGLLQHLHLQDRVTVAPTEHPTLQPGRAAALRLDDEEIGVFGEMHPLVRAANELPEQRIALADLDLSPLLSAISDTYYVEPVPRFPAVVEDIAVVVEEEVPAADVAAVIREAGGELLRRVELFDVYRGTPLPAGHKSLAYRLNYQALDQTLTDEAAASIRTRISAALADRLDASIRSGAG